MNPSFLSLSGVVGLLCCLFSFSFGQVKNGSGDQEAGSEIEWISFEEAVERNKKDPKKILIDVYTEWCGWCKKMDATTFRQKEIVDYVRTHYHAVKFDGEYKNDITVGGTTYKFIPNGRRGTHELAAVFLEGQMRYPSIVFLDESFNMIQPVPGFRTAKEIEPIIHFFGENEYIRTQWEVYEQSFKSNIKD